MKWSREEVTFDNAYVVEVVGLWKTAYQTRDACVTIVVFCDEPDVWYVRNDQSEHRYDRSTCLPNKFKTLKAAKDAAEMLMHMGALG
jgi:hypothetical protein